MDRRKNILMNGQWQEALPKRGTNITSVRYKSSPHGFPSFPKEN